MRKKGKKKIDKLLSLLIIVLFVPVFIVSIGRRVQLEELLYGAAQAAAGEDETIQQIIGIVAKEISPSANVEAILAQCVIARTNLCDARARGTAEPEGLDRKEMQNLWGDHFQEYYDRLAESVYKTEDEVLLWEGDYIYAAYHAVSAGSTRGMEELYPDADMPYLQAKPCGEDAVAEKYLTVSYWEKDEFLRLCSEHFPEGAAADLSDIAIETRDTAGYVTAVKIGETGCDGEQFRAVFGLPSACFALAEVDGRVRIVTKGLGHGFGLSQNTAEIMAENGSGYREILAYFFPGTEISRDLQEK